MLPHSEEELQTLGFDLASDVGKVQRDDFILLSATVSESGYLTLRYSGYLFSTNYGQIRAILLELSIVANDLGEQLVDFDWNVIGVTNAQIFVQISFDDPLTVSNKGY